MKGIVFTILLLFLTGCASSGYKFNEDNTSKLQISETSISQAKVILDGEPYQVISNGNSDFLSWIYTSASPFGSTNKMIQLQFVNDKLLKVVQFSGFNLSDSERRRLMLTN